MAISELDTTVVEEVVPITSVEVAKQVVELGAPTEGKAARSVTLRSTRSELSLSKKRDIELQKKKQVLEHRQIEIRKQMMYEDSVTSSYRKE
jgi:hypothetical protein